LQRVPVRLEVVDALAMAGAVDPDRERSLRGDVGILLSQRTRGGIARVRRGGLSFGGETLVELAESAQRHVDLTAHLEHGRRAFVLHLEWYCADRAEVRSDILALHAVAARRAAREASVLA